MEAEELYMSYPKPLSEKSLERLYTQAGLSTEACDFLHSLFAACANLYGAIALRDVWSVYQELKSDVPRIHRRDLIAFSSIVRREVQPYWVYEIEELYTEEPHNDLDRHIVSKELIGAGYGKMFSFYALMDERDDRPYCVPDDFLSYAEPTASVEEKSLADFIGNLKSTAMECAPKQRKTYPNENRGKKLNEFSFLNLNERFNLDYYKKVPATYSALLAEYSGTEAEKIMRFHRRAENVGHLRTTDMIQNVLIELCEVGVRRAYAFGKKLYGKRKTGNGFYARRNVFETNRKRCFRVRRNYFGSHESRLKDAYLAESVGNTTPN